MNKSLLIPAASFAVLMLGLAACTPSKEDPPPKPKVTADVTPAAEPGNRVAMLPKLGPAPAWRLQDLAGKLVTSEQFKGKVVVVDFWATWCPPCRAEIPGYTQLQKKYGNDGLVIVGVSLDQAGPDVVKAFADKNGINYPLVMGDESIVGAFGGVEGIPTTFLIDRSGQIRDRKDGMEETAEYEKKIAAVIGEKT
jgi:thiol-disulfide isomerase/thioredoxin